MKHRTGYMRFLRILILSSVFVVSGTYGASDFPYCDVPLKLDDNSHAVKKNMQLQQLLVVIRHGDRTPVTKIDGNSVPWVCDDFAHT